jgi:lipopolysaccharide assembly outer membrane protein LptD (OstA)
MRGTLIVALLVVACAITGAAQGTPNGLGLPRGSAVTAALATSSTKGEVVFSGNVTIAMSGVTVTADRATFHEASQTFELDGHVQLKVTAPVK